jgi:hypothetical protein
VIKEIRRPLGPLHLLLALVLFCGLAILSYPYYRYYIDPDAVAYLTMAKRAAGGEPWRLVNALWSPMHPALVALCIKGGIDALLAAHLTNALACILVLIGCYQLFRRYALSRVIALPLLLSLAVFLTYALYKQLFCDLWQVALLLFYLLLVSSPRFLQKPILWLLCALLMAAAAYAKVYSFYFLLLHFPVALWLKQRAEGTSFPLKAYALTFITHLLLLLPLVALMHQKYGFWGLSKSGSLNTSWTLVGHKSLRPDIQTLIPPPYPNSPYTWEDPYLSEGELHSRFESLSMMKSQLGHSINAALQGVEAAGQISPFLLIVLAATAIAIIVRIRPSFNTGLKILLAGAIILPLGYLLLHFEARYIWLLIPIGMLFGGLWLERLQAHIANRAVFIATAWLFALSFIVYPLYDMKALFRKGENIYQLATNLTSLGIRGSFTSNDNPSRSGLLAYWLGCNYYTPAGEVLPPQEVLAAMRRYKVSFYFHHQNGLDAAQAFMVDEQSHPFKRVDAQKIPGLQVFLITTEP